MEQELITLINSIEIDLFWWIIKFSMVFIILVGLKGILNLYVLLLKYKFSDQFSKNQIITYNNWTGKIIKIGLYGMVLQNIEGDELIIPLDRIKYGEVIFPSIDYKDC